MYFPRLYLRLYLYHLIIRCATRAPIELFTLEQKSKEAGLEG